MWSFECVRVCVCAQRYMHTRYVGVFVLDCAHTCTQLTRCVRCRRQQRTTLRPAVVGQGRTVLRVLGLLDAIWPSCLLSVWVWLADSTIRTIPKAALIKTSTNPEESLHLVNTMGWYGFVVRCRWSQSVMIAWISYRVGQHVCVQLLLLIPFIPWSDSHVGMVLGLLTHTHAPATSFYLFWDRKSVV